jgi:hypothetical protein
LQENEDILKYLKSIFFVANSEKSKIWRIWKAFYNYKNKIDVLNS